MRALMGVGAMAAAAAAVVGASKPVSCAATAASSPPSPLNHLGRRQSASEGRTLYCVGVVQRVE